MASSPPHHPASEPHRQATEDEVQAWVETGQRPRSSRPKSSRVKVRDEVRPKSSRKKQQAWADEPGPLQAVLDMHASAVEQLHHVSYTSSKLQEEFDVVRAQFETATVQTQYEDSVIRNIENTADQLQLNLTRIEDRVVQLIRANFDQEDHAAMQQLHRHIEDQLRQEVQDAYARNAKERKMAERVPDLLKELDDHKEILDETVTDRERYKLDVQLLQDKVRMVTSRAESAEQMREQALDREAALVKRVEQLSDSLDPSPNCHLNTHKKEQDCKAKRPLLASQPIVPLFAHMCSLQQTVSGCTDPELQFAALGPEGRISFYK